MSLLTVDNKKTIINPENILDISSGKLLTGKSVVVDKGRISAIIGKKDINNSREFADIINIPDLTLIPGLIDSHVHLALNAKSYTDNIGLNKESAVIEKKIKEKLKRYLDYGIIAVRDGGDKGNIGLKAKKISCRDDLLAPIINASGYVIRKKGYYGAFLGEGVTDLRKIECIIKKLAQNKVNQIKVLISGIVSFKNYGKVGPLQFSLTEIKRIVEKSHEMNLKVMAHASSDKAVQVAVEAGVDSIEHGYFVKNSTLKQMVERNSFWVPTVVPVYKQYVMPWKEKFTDKQISIISKTYNHQHKTIKRAAKFGVNLAVGTDAGASAVPHGKSYYTELELYKKAGLSNLEILKAATIKGAELLGLQNEIGSIKPGKLPYLIAVKGNPLLQLNGLQSPEVVIAPG